MADAEIAGELAHVARAEDIADVAAALVHVEHRAFAGHDAGGVLPAMLQQQQAVVEQLIDRRVRDDAYDSAHGSVSPSGARDADCALVARGLPVGEKSSRAAHSGGM